MIIVYTKNVLSVKRNVWFVPSPLDRLFLKQTTLGCRIKKQVPVMGTRLAIAFFQFGENLWNFSSFQFFVAVVVVAFAKL